MEGKKLFNLFKNEKKLKVMMSKSQEHFLGWYTNTYLCVVVVHGLWPTLFYHVGVLREITRQGA